MLFVKKLRLAIIIINYKTPKLVIDCLSSLLPELKGVNAKVVVVDNASQDDSCLLIGDWITEHSADSQVELLASNENAGFSAGNNLGIQQAEAEHYLLLNSDTIVREGAIALLLEAAEKETSAGLISPRLEWPDAERQESCFQFHTPISEFASSAGTGAITKLCYSYLVPNSISDENTYCDWTSFACVLIKAKVFKDIGLMDSGFFMYFEDMAFCHKAKQRGWKILNLPSAHVVHLRGGSSQLKTHTRLRKRLPHYFYESRTRCFYLAYGYLGLLLANLLWEAGFVISLMRSLLSSDYVPNRTTLQWKDIWINFLSPLGSYTHPDACDSS